MIPVEVGVSSLRYQWTREETNNQELADALDLLDERREQALVRIAAYQSRATRFYNKSVKERQFQVGDWVLRKVFRNTPDSKDGKLSPTFEGPYQVVSIKGPCAYELIDKNGKPLQRSWSVIHLKRYVF